MSTRAFAYETEEAIVVSEFRTPVGLRQIFEQLAPEAQTRTTPQNIEDVMEALQGLCTDVCES